MATRLRALFKPGQVLATPAALGELAEAGQSPLDLLLRYLGGDWGDVCDKDARANQVAVLQGHRIVSAYALATGTRVWIISEWDRSAIILPLPDEY